MNKRYVYLMAGVILVAGVVDTVAQRGRRGGGRINAPAARQAVSQRQSLPNNYGSIRQVERPVRTNTRIQPIVESGSRDTHRGGDVEWRKAPGGQAVVKGETARGRTYGGAQAANGTRSAAVKTHSGDVMVRNRSGNKGVYRNVGDDWRQVDYVGVPYYYHSHHWYYPYYYGGSVYYHEVYPPADAMVDELPKDAKVVEIDGREYILWDGVST